MKRFIAILFLLAFVSLANGQNKVNYWMSGFNSMVRFDDDGPHYFYRPDPNNFWRTSASISDSAGNLLFYTNGYRVFNKNFQVMPNGDDLNIGDYENWGYDLLSVGDGASILPVPGSSSRFYLFHFDINVVETVEGQGPWPTNLFYCLIDMDLDGGNGDIVSGQKDVLVLNDTMTQLGVKAARHGNGRDWWILCHEYGTNRYYRFLINPDGIHGPYSQNIGIHFSWYNAQVSSPMKFYNQDQSFVQLSSDSIIAELYDFDRCTGLLSNRNVVILGEPQQWVRGISISPNNRFMYVSSNFTEILQFDLWASDISASRTVVGVDDGIGDPFPATFSYQELGPDGKIYVQTYHSSHALHVIHQPDSLGLACDFEQRGFYLDSLTNWSPIAPNVPNYSFGALAGSGCDTLTSTTSLPAPVFTWSVYPNPFVGEFRLSCTGVTSKSLLEVHNVLGQSVYTTELSPVNPFIHQAVDATSFAPGVYLITLTIGENRYSRTCVKK